jgi:transposase-like protein
MAGRQERVEPLDRAYDLSSFSSEVEAVARGDRSMQQCPNNRIECDHGRLKARLRPMRGLKQDRSARVVIAGHALVQNIRRGHYELAVEEPTNRRLAVAFEELILAI